jgi:polar amino acid transport system substrate-binding protein
MVMPGLNTGARGRYRCGTWLFIVLMCCFSLSSHAEKVTLLSIEYPPYTGHALKHGGIATAIAAAAFKREGYQLEVEYRPWARALQEVKEGKYAGVIDIWYSRERSAFIAFSKPIFISEVGFYGRSDQKIDVRDLTKLGKVTIGVTRDALKPPVFNTAHLRTEDALDDANNLVKLTAGRVDLVLTEKRVAEYLLQDQLKAIRAKVVWLEPSIYQIPLYIGFSRRYPGGVKLASAFDAGLASVEKDGTLEKMRAEKGY